VLLVLLATCTMALMTRHVYSEFNDADAIARGAVVCAGAAMVAFPVLLTVDSAATRTLIVVAAVCFSTTHLVVAVFAPKIAPMSTVASFFDSRPASWESSRDVMQGRAGALLTREQIVEMDGDGKNVLIGELQARVARGMEKLREADQLVEQLKAGGPSGAGAEFMSRELTRVLRRSSRRNSRDSAETVDDEAGASGDTTTTADAPAAAASRSCWSRFGPSRGPRMHQLSISFGGISTTATFGHTGSLGTTTASKTTGSQQSETRSSRKMSGWSAGSQPNLSSPRSRRASRGATRPPEQADPSRDCSPDVQHTSPREEQLDEHGLELTATSRSLSDLLDAPHLSQSGRL
jgi:hypothetical protein